MRVRLNPIASLVLDRTLYPRLRVDTRLVTDYAAAMQGGSKFPPVSVATVDGKRVVLDGWHRIRAAKLLNLVSITTTDLGRMERPTAYQFAVKRNTTHGRPLDYSERMKAYKRMVKEGIPIMVATDAINLSPDRIRLSPGRLKGVGSEVDAGFGSVSLRMLGPVMTVSDAHGFAGSLSMKQGTDGGWDVNPKSAARLVRLTVRLLSGKDLDWSDRELVGELRRLKELLNGLKWPKE